MGMSIRRYVCVLFILRPCSAVPAQLHTEPSRTIQLHTKLAHDQPRNLESLCRRVPLCCHGWGTTWYFPARPTPTPARAAGSQPIGVAPGPNPADGCPSSPQARSPHALPGVVAATPRLCRPRASPATTPGPLSPSGPPMVLLSARAAQPNRRPSQSPTPRLCLVGVQTLPHLRRSPSGARVRCLRVCVGMRGCPFLGLRRHRPPRHPRLELGANRAVEQLQPGLRRQAGSFRQALAPADA